MKKVKDLKWGIEYDFDEKTQTVSKVLQIYNSDGTVTEERFEYEYVKSNFSEPYDSKTHEILKAFL